MFCRSKTPEPYQLPPTKDELLQHIKRANYQSFVWKQALDSSFEVESPVGHGWQENYGNLEVMWMERKPAPESVLELITCTCRRSVCGEECQCWLLSLECTDLCKCTGNCDNVQYGDNEEQETDDEDEESADDEDSDEEGCFN